MFVENSPFIFTCRLHTLVTYHRVESLCAFSRDHSNMIHLGLKVSAQKSKMIFLECKSTSSVKEGQRALYSFWRKCCILHKHPLHPDKKALWRYSNILFTYKRKYTIYSK